VSTIYAPQDSYKDITEGGDADGRDESDLRRMYARSSTATLVPLSALAQVTRRARTGPCLSPPFKGNFPDFGKVKARPYQPGSCQHGLAPAIIFSNRSTR
jgi:hypothetical protein